MKKLMILAVAAALLGMAAPNTMAQVPGSSQPSSSSSSHQDDKDDISTGSSSTTTQPGTSGTQSGAQQGTSGSSGSMGTSGSSSSMVEYNDEVKSSELPAAITSSINEKYPGYTTDKAYRGSDGTYKVKVKKGDESQALFFDARGQFVKSKSYVKSSDKTDKQETR